MLVVNHPMTQCCITKLPWAELHRSKLLQHKGRRKSTHTAGHKHSRSMGNDMGVVCKCFAQPDSFGPAWRRFSICLDVSKNCFTKHAKLSSVHAVSAPFKCCGSLLDNVSIAQPCSMKQSPIENWMCRRKNQLFTTNCLFDLRNQNSSLQTQLLQGGFNCTILLMVPFCNGLMMYNNSKSSACLTYCICNGQVGWLKV